MDNYLIDRETLGKFIDELIKKKALPVDSPEELNRIREEGIKNLDQKIGVAIFSSLTKEQYAKFDELVDQPDATQETFEAFFEESGVDIAKIVTESAKEFGYEFLGGQNA